jgi:serine/threonine-protein phosphatase 2A activator
MTETDLPDRIKPFYDFIEKIHNMLDEVPPVDQPMRFGNKAFKTWIDKINLVIEDDIAAMMQAGNPNFTHFGRAIPELKDYLIDSFGSYERIDYGTGHELNFVMFIYCMCKIGIYTIEDYKPLINKVF